MRGPPAQPRTSTKPAPFVGSEAGERQAAVESQTRQVREGLVRPVPRTDAGAQRHKTYLRRSASSVQTLASSYLKWGVLSSRVASSSPSTALLFCWIATTSARSDAKTWLP